jgi:hypothetical protein
MLVHRARADVLHELKNIGVGLYNARIRAVS